MEVSSTGSVPDYELGVSKSHETIQNRQTKEVIAESWRFVAWRGWLDAWISSVINNSAGGCDGGQQAILRSFAHKILIPPEKQP
jgi:hypothetical protein